MRVRIFGTASLLSLALIAGVRCYLLSGGTTAVADNQPVPSKLAKSRIERVTVYPTNALITREVEVPDGNGLVELVVSPMPEQIVPSTLYCEGSESLRVLTTRFSTHQVLEDTSAARRKLEAEQEKLQAAAARINSDIAALMQNMTMLIKIEGISEKGKHTGDEVIAMAKYVMEQRDLKAKDMVALQELKRLNNVKIEFVTRKLGELGGGSGRLEREAIIVVDRDNAKAGKIRLNYLVGSVTWRPEYKLRAGKANEDVRLDYLANLRQNSGEDWSHVKLTLSTAQPMLNSAPPELCMLQPILVARGQAGAPPMSATASPFANPVAPEEIAARAQSGRAQASQLNSLGNYGQMPMQMPMQTSIPMQMPMQMPMNPNMPGMGVPPAPNNAPVLPFLGPMQSQTQLPAFGQQPPSQALVQKEADRILNESAALEQNLDLMRSRDEVIAQQKKLRKAQPDVDPSRSDGPTVTYHLPSKLSVPSRNDEQVVEIVKLNLTPKFYYKAVPVLNRHVYRLADLVNKSGHELLPGEATMYQGTDFVGRMPMPLVAIGEEFTAGFGVDTQLQIQRQMIDQTRSTQGGNQVLKYDYRILINSYKNESVKLQLWDRLPKGANESINIQFGKCTPALSNDGLYLRESRPNNLLRWDVDVPANCNGEKAFPVTYDFRMELDRQMAITGFQSR